MNTLFPVKKILPIFLIVSVLLLIGFGKVGALSNQEVINQLKQKALNTVKSQVGTLPDVSGLESPLASGSTLSKKGITEALNELTNTYGDLIDPNWKKILNSQGKVSVGDLFGAVKPTGNKEKFIYLTFDDGPNEPFSSEVLDILKRQKVKATFFTIGKNAAKQPATLKRIKEEGHNLGIHSYTHSPLASLSIEKEVEDTNKIIEKATGQRSDLFRPPFGVVTPSAKKWLDGKGYKVVMADVMAYDWQNISSEEVKNNVLKKVKPGSVIVLHDGRGTKAESSLNTVKAVEPIIEALKKQGYSFRKVDKSSDVSLNFDRIRSLLSR